MTVAITARWCIKFIVVEEISNGVGCNESGRQMKWFEQGTGQNGEGQKFANLSLVNPTILCVERATEEENL